MIRTFLTMTLFTAAALAGCTQQDQAGAGNEPENERTAAQANVVLPPPILASKIYRCNDNSIVYVDWLSGDTSANVRTQKDGAATAVAASEAGKPMTAEGGWSLTGSSKSATITLARPGKGSQSCDS